MAGMRVELTSRFIKPGLWSVTANFKGPDGASVLRFPSIEVAGVEGEAPAEVKSRGRAQLRMFLQELMDALGDDATGN